jgi:hypothetical protein
MRGRFLNNSPLPRSPRIFGAKNALANYPARVNVAD